MVMRRFDDDIDLRGNLASIDIHLGKKLTDRTNQSFLCQENEHYLVPPEEVVLQRNAAGLFADTRQSSVIKDLTSVDRIRLLLSMPPPRFRLPEAEPDWCEHASH
jgi:hypothetical protein